MYLISKKLHTIMIGARYVSYRIQRNSLQIFCTAIGEENFACSRSMSLSCVMREFVQFFIIFSGLLFSADVQ